jgi:hypothetical protein
MRDGLAGLGIRTSVKQDADGFARAQALGIFWQNEKAVGVA